MRDRVVYGHLKDFTAEPFAFLPLGRGHRSTSPLCSTRSRAAPSASGSPSSSTSTTVPPIDAAKVSKAYLASLGLE